MQITKVSLWSGKTHTMELPITDTQWILWQNGVVIQNAMPHLTASEGEFLISGVTADEWRDMCGPEDNEEK